MACIDRRSTHLSRRINLPSVLSGALQVGDGDTDHYCWQRPEDMTTSRQAYKVDRDHPGSDVAGETAAALAAASMAFRDTNPHYAHLLLHHAQQVRTCLRTTYTCC